MEIMTKEKAEKLREEYRKRTAPWTGGLFQHFASEQEKQDHMDDVAQAVARGEIPF